MKIFIKPIHVNPAVIKLFLLVGLIWASLVGPFASILILKSIGATSRQIGAFTAICAVASMLAQPVWGLVSDRLGSPRRVLCICLAASTVFFGSIYFTDRFFVAAALLLADNIFRCCIITLLDSHTMSETQTVVGLRYGYIRLAGSIFYGIVSIAYGNIISASGAKAIMPFSICIAAVAVIYGLFFAKGGWEEKAGNQETGYIRKAKSNLKGDAKALFKNKLFVAYILFTALNALATNPIYTFMIDFVTAVGGSAGDVPMINAAKCALEIPVMIFTGVFARRIDAKKLMLIGVFFTLFQMAGLAIADTPELVFLFFFMGTPGFVLCLAGKMQYIRDITPESVRSTSYTVAGAFEVGLGAIAGNYIGGYISEVYGTRALAFMEVIAIIIALSMLLFILRMSRQEQAK